MTNPDKTPPSDDAPVDEADPQSESLNSARTEPLDPATEGGDPPHAGAGGSIDSPDEPPERQVDSLREKLLTVGIASGLGFGALAVSFGIILPLFVFISVLEIPVPESPLALISAELFVSQVVGMGGISAAYLWYTGRGFDYIPIRRPTLIETAIIIAAPFGIIFVTATISQLSMFIGIEPSEHALGALGDIDPTLYLYMIPLVIFIVGPFEELLYRGVVQSRLRESFGAAAAIGLASLVFALIHIPAHGFGGAGVAATAASMAALFGGSLVFGAIYEYTENLTVVALIHGFYNAILLALVYTATVYGPEIEAFAEQTEQAVVLVGL